MRALGLVMSDEAARNADEFGDTLNQLSLVADAVGRKFANEFAPEITNAMKDIEESLIDNQGEWTSWGGFVRDLIRGLRIEVKAFASLLAQGTLDPRQFQIELGLAKIQQEGKDAQRKLAGLASRQTGVRSRAGAGGDGGAAGADKAAQEARRVLEESEKEAANILKKGRDLAEREYKQNLISLRAYTEKVIELEQTKLASLRIVFDQELALAKKESDRAKIKNDIAKAEADSAKAVQDAQDKQNDAELAAASAHGQALLSLFDEFSQRQIEATRNNAELNKTTFEDAELAVLAIQTRVYNERLAFLVAEEERAGENLEKRRAINDQVVKLHADQEAFQNEHDRKMEDARKKDLEREKAYLDALYNIDKVAFDKRVALDRLRLQREFDSGLLSRDQKLFNIQERERIDIAASAADRLREEKEATERVRAILAEETDLQRRADILAAHFALIEQIQAEFEQRKADRKAESATEGQGGGFLGGIVEALGNPNDIKTTEDAWRAAGATIAGVMGSLAQGLGSVVQQWVLYGSAGPNALRKMVAAVLAAAAAQAIVEAIMEGARGLAELAAASASLAVFDVRGAALHTAAAHGHFAAAAMFAAIGGVAAIAGRVIAGGAFATGGAAGGGGGAQGGRAAGTTQTEDEARIIELERSQRAIDVNVRVDLRTNDSHIIDSVVSNVHNDGRLRKMIVGMVEA